MSILNNFKDRFEEFAANLSTTNAGNKPVISNNDYYALLESIDQYHNKIVDDIAEKLKKAHLANIKHEFHKLAYEDKIADLEEQQKEFITCIKNLWEIVIAANRTGAHYTGVNFTKMLDATAKAKQLVEQYNLKETQANENQNHNEPT